MSVLVFVNMLHSRKRKEKKNIKQQKFIKDGKGKLPLAERMLCVHQIVFHFPPGSFAHFMSLCHILVILTIFQTFFIIIIFVMMICDVSDLECY